MQYFCGLFSDICDFWVQESEKFRIFKYRNNTNVAIVIQKVIVSCGCTQVEWSGKPTKPGENGEIKVLFSNQIGSGHFDKSIAVYVSSSPNQIILRVRGEVLEAEEKGEATSPAP